MPAVSQKQQKLFGMALAYKRGRKPAETVPPEVKRLADSMSLRQLEDFAATKLQGLPKQAAYSPFHTGVKSANKLIRMVEEKLPVLGAVPGYWLAEKTVGKIDPKHDNSLTYELAAILASTLGGNIGQLVAQGSTYDALVKDKSDIAGRAMAGGVGALGAMTGAYLTAVPTLALMHRHAKHYDKQKKKQLKTASLQDHMQALGYL